MVDVDDHVIAGTSDGLEGPFRVVTMACAVGPRRWDEGPDRQGEVHGGLAQVSSPGAVRGGGRQLSGSGDGLGFAEEDEEKSPGPINIVFVKLQRRRHFEALENKQSG